MSIMKRSLPNGMSTSELHVSAKNQLYPRDVTYANSMCPLKINY